MTTTMIFTIFIFATLVGLFFAWRHGAKCYDRGITDAVIMHNNGRLQYTSYVDDNGAKKVNIEIDPLDS